MLYPENLKAIKLTRIFCPRNYFLQNENYLCLKESGNNDDLLVISFNEMIAKSFKRYTNASNYINTL